MGIVVVSNCLSCITGLSASVDYCTQSGHPHSVTVGKYGGEGYRSSHHTPLYPRGGHASE